MEQLIAHIPLSLGAVLLRTLVDSYTGNVVPPLQSTFGLPSGIAPAAASAVLGSGAAVFGLYKQLRKGTLVNVGLGKKVSGMIKNAKHLIQRRERNGDSWLLRNINGSRRNCMKALEKLGDQPIGLVPNREPVHQSSLGQSNSSPDFYQHSPEVPSVENLYSNVLFDPCHCSTHQSMKTPSHSRASERRRPHVPQSLHRPITRNYYKFMNPSDDEPEKRIPPTRKKRVDHPIIIENKTSVLSTPSIHHFESERSPRKSLSRLRELPANSRPQRRRGKVQKFTRKTRSGKVYVYRI